MNRRNRTLLVLLVAVGLASLATYGVFRTIKSIPVRQVEVATKHVVVAAENLPLGTRVSKEQLKVVGWPAATPVEGSFASVEEIVGRGLIQPVQANELLTETKLAPKEAGAGLSPSIPPGMRALSVKVNDVIGVAGFTVPGARVDVVVVVKDRDNSMARVVVSNLQVLTAGTQVRHRAGERRQTDAVERGHLAGHAGTGGAHHARANQRVDHSRAAQSAGRDADRDQRRSDGGTDGEPVDGASRKTRPVEAQQSPGESSRRRTAAAAADSRGQSLKPFVRANALSRMSSNGHTVSSQLQPPLCAGWRDRGVDADVRSQWPGPGQAGRAGSAAATRGTVAAGDAANHRHRGPLDRADDRLQRQPDRSDQSGRGGCDGGRAARDSDRRQSGGHDQPDCVG